MVAERISDGLAVLMLSVLGVVAYPQYWPAFALILGVLLGAVIISQIRPAALWLLALGERIPGLRRIVHHLREFYEGSFSLFKPGATLAAVGLGTVSWLGEGIGFYFLLVGLGIQPSERLLSLAIFILAFSTIVGSVTALPGGLGAAEASIAGMLALLAGLDAPQAAAATLLARLATLWFGVALGLITWTFSGIYLECRRKMDRSLKVEFHCHSNASRDSLTRVGDLLQAARRAGIDRLMLTDHNTIQGALEAHASTRSW